MEEFEPLRKKIARFSKVTFSKIQKKSEEPQLTETKKQRATNGSILSVILFAF